MSYQRIIATALGFALALVLEFLLDNGLAITNVRRLFLLIICLLVIYVCCAKEFEANPDSSDEIAEEPENINSIDRRRVRRFSANTRQKLKLINSTNK